MAVSARHLVRVVCRPAQAAAFELAGVVPEVAPDAPRALEALKRLAGEDSVAVILVDEGLHQALPADLRLRLDRQAEPIVTPFPSPKWDGPLAAEAYVLEILRRAIGYRVRPR
jgi:vacuolar-type H+-ATPase subunit F/Vma7